MNFSPSKQGFGLTDSKCSSSSNIFGFVHQSLDYVFNGKCHPLNKKIHKYKTVNTKCGKGVDLSSTASYAVINCELSQAQYENEVLREAQSVGRSQFALVQEGRSGVKDATSGTPLIHGGDVWHRQGYARQRMMSNATISRQGELQ